MEKTATFAYMVFSCVWSPALAAEFGDWFWADFVECSLSIEEQAQEPSEVWAYDLEYGLSRIAPVQVTLGWDPRPTLLQVFAIMALQPHFQSPKKRENNWLAFPTPTQPLPWQQVIPDVVQQDIPNALDFGRFQDVINATVEIAKAQNGSLVFVGGEGFDYHVNAAHLNGALPILQKTSLKFFDRHA